MSDFKTKTAIVDYLRSRLHKAYVDGSRITRGRDFELLSDVVSNHPRKDEVIGDGIDHFIVSKCNVDKRNKKYSVVQVDGTIVDFSYKKAVSGKKTTDEQYLKRAFRNAVYDYTSDFKHIHFAYNADSRGYCVCELTGLKFTIENAHVDHKYPKTFNALFYQYFKERKLKFSQVKYKREGKNNIPVLDDNKIERDWWNWHRENADLRCVYWRANLQHKRTGDYKGRTPAMNQ